MPNWMIIASTWRQWKSQALTWWSELSESDWNDIDGSREKLVDALAAKYGWTHEQADQEVETRFHEYASALK